MQKHKKTILILLSVLLLLGLGGSIFAINQHSLNTKSDTQSSKSSISHQAKLKNDKEENTTSKKSSSFKSDNTSSSQVNPNKSTIQQDNHSSSSNVVPDSSSIQSSTEQTSSVEQAEARTNGTWAAILAKRYYQRTGSDNNNLIYSGYLSEDGKTYQVRVVDLVIRSRGGTGTVDILTVDSNGNVTPLTF